MAADCAYRLRGSASRSRRPSREAPEYVDVTEDVVRRAEEQRVRQSAQQSVAIRDPEIGSRGRTLWQPRPPPARQRRANLRLHKPSKIRFPKATRRQPHVLHEA